MVRAGDAFELAIRHSMGVTVEFANRVMYEQRDDLDSLRRLLAVPELSAVWRETLSERLVEAEVGS